MFVFLLPVLIIFACQAMWVWHAYDYEDFPRSRLIGFELITLLALIVVFSAVSGRMPVGFLLLGAVMPTIGWFLLIYLEETTLRRQVRAEEGGEIRRWMNAIEQDPEHYVAHERLGNIHFERRNFEKALEHYSRARAIKDTPALIHKCRMTEKEYRIQKGKLWVCTECSYENTGEIASCRHCGHMRGHVAEAKVSIARRRDEIKRDSLRVMGGSAVVLLVIWLARALPDLAGIYVALVASLFVMFFLAWKFIKF